MILLIARREMLGHLRSTRFLVLCGFVTALLGTGAYVESRELAARAAYADALESMRQSALAFTRGQGEETLARFGWRAGRMVADPALRAIRPPTAASVFALGGEHSTARFWQFGTEGVAPGSSVDAEATVPSAGATLDFEFIVRSVLSLLAVLIAADAIAGERESGVLRTLFASPASRLDVLLGKCLGGMLTLCAPLLVGSAVTAGVLITSGVPLFEADVWPRALAIVVGSLLYLSAMFALGTGVSAVSRETRTATVALLGVWVALVFVAPSGAAQLARVYAPVTPAELVRQSRADGLRQLESERARALAAVWRTVNGSDALPNDGPVPDDVRRRYDLARRPVETALMHRKRALLRTMDDERLREASRQERVLTVLAAVSPAGAYSAFADAVAGTGTALRERWERAARDQQRRLEHAIYDRSYGTELFDARADYLKITYQPNPGDPADRVPPVSDLPAFDPPAPDLAGDLRRALPSLLVLMLDAVVFLAVAAAAVVRMEV